MIVAIDGKVVKKELTAVHVKLSSGLTYGVFVSMQTSSALSLDEEISLHIKEVIREDAHLLYGFLNLDEQAMFEALLKVNGVGASTAMAVCSTLSVKDFASALSSGSVEAFKKVPGIGPKTAKRILVELSEFALQGQGADPIHAQARQALEGLGFKKEKINSALKDLNASSTSELVKLALKKLS